MAEVYHNLSLRLYDILDWIGASEEMRSTIRENATVGEILETRISALFDDYPYKNYVFGSYGEGTTTPGLHSDKDTLCCYKSTVVENISHLQEKGRAYVMVADETTQPGYYKLQLVIDTFPINHGFTIANNIDPSVLADETVRPDSYGRICLESVKFRDENFPDNNGPAITSSTEEGMQDIDVVLAVGCQYIPSCANSWIKRVVSCDRFNAAQTKRLKEFGCFFVGTRHPSSQNGLIEWRISFSLQERELMASLNSTQHKCYVFLKMIKKDLIHKHAPKSISSYHCKTCVLYAIERTPCAFWSHGNFLECVRFCILLLLHWVNENRCPNYFVPDENMFERLENRSLRQVQHVLEDMLEHWCSFLWSLTCDNIGELLNDVLFGSGTSIMKVKRGKVSEQSQALYRNLTSILKANTNKLLSLCKGKSADQAVLDLQSIENYFITTNCVEDYTEVETRLAIRYFIPYARLQIAQYIASIMLTTRNEGRLKMLFGQFEYYKDEAKDCDVASSYLIVASYHLQRERLDICKRILLECETTFKSYVLSVCNCNHRQKMYLNGAINEQVRILRSHSIESKEYSRTYTSGCLIFLPHQANLVHPALHYEMYRSVNTPAGSRHERLDAWFDWIVVDSKVYLYFLQYVLFSKTNKTTLKLNAIDTLWNIIRRDENLGHRDTAYNLLGWIFTQENKIQRALRCFLKSWRIRPIHNAAIWHVLSMISSRNTLN